MTNLEDWRRFDATVRSVDTSQIPAHIPQDDRESLIEYHPKVSHAMVSADIFNNEAGIKVLKFVFPQPPIGWWLNTVDLLSTLEFVLAPNNVPELLARNLDGSPLGAIDSSWDLQSAKIAGADDEEATFLQWHHRGIDELVTTLWRWR